MVDSSLYFRCNLQTIPGPLCFNCQQRINQGLQQQVHGACDGGLFLNRAAGLLLMALGVFYKEEGQSLRNAEDTWVHAQK